LFSIAKKYFDKVNPGGRLWAFKSFYYGPFIPGQKLQEAREEYANYDDEQERPIIYVDNSRVGRMGSIDSSGLMITNRYFYYKLKMKLKDKQFIIGKISIEEIKTFQIKCKFWGWIIINPGRRTFKLSPFSFWDRKEAKVLEGLMQKLIQQLNTNSARLK
jgi:hypothetical protein